MNIHLEKIIEIIFKFESTIFNTPDGSVIILDEAKYNVNIYYKGELIDLENIVSFAEKNNIMIGY